MSGFHDRMAAAERWEYLLGDFLRGRGWQVEKFGQGTLSLGARRILHATPRTALIRWLPDLIVARGNEAMFIDAKNSEPHEHTRCHSVEIASSAAMDFVHNDTGLTVWYAFVHPRACTAGDHGRDLYPSFVDHKTFSRMAVSKSFSGRGSGTPFRVANCQDACQYAPKVRLGA